MIESLILHRLAEFGKSASPRTREQRFSLPRGVHINPHVVTEMNVFSDVDSNRNRMDFSNVLARQNI